MKTLQESEESYLKQRFHVFSIDRALPNLKEVYTGPYIELDFPENIAMRPKNEVQSAHFSGN